MAQDLTEVMEVGTVAVQLVSLLVVVAELLTYDLEASLRLIG